MTIIIEYRCRFFFLYCSQIEKISKKRLVILPISLLLLILSYVESLTSISSIISCLYFYHFKTFWRVVIRSFRSNKVPSFTLLKCILEGLFNTWKSFFKETDQTWFLLIHFSIFTINLVSKKIHICLPCIRT